MRVFKAAGEITCFEQKKKSKNDRFLRRNNASQKSMEQ